MARVIRLPDPSVFQRKQLTRDPTQLSIGTKGTFKITDVIDMADKIVKSEGVGSIASAIERGLEPGEEKAVPKIPETTDALRKAAEARTSMRVQGEPEIAEGTPVGQAARTAGIPELAPRPERRLPSPTMASTQMPVAPMELPTQVIEGQVPPVTTTVEPRDQALTQPRTRVERRLVRNTREAIAAGGPPVVYEDQLARSPAGVIEQPKVPPLKVPGPAAPQTPVEPPSIGQAPTPAPEQLAATGGPSRAVSEPVQVPAVRQAQPVPPSGETPPLSAPGKVEGTSAQQAKATAQQVIANIQRESQRGEPAAAAVIDMAAYQASQDKPISVAQFYSSMIDELKGKGYYKESEAFDIPRVISVENLIAFARQADTPDKQKAVLDAFANNTVTGMGYTTLSQRLSGQYRKPYLSAIISSFPAKGKDIMGDIYKLSLAYQASGVGAGRYADIGAGRPQAGVTKTLAEAGKAAAGGQLQAEKAVTERETRTARVQNLLGQGVQRLYRDAIRASLKPGPGKRAKVNLPVLQRETTGRYEKEQGRLETTMDKQDKEIARLEGIAAGQPEQELDPRYYATVEKIDAEIARQKGLAIEPTPLSRAEVVRDPVLARENAKQRLEAQRAKARIAELERQRGEVEKRYRSMAKPKLTREQAAAQLATLRQQRAGLQELYDGLLEQRARFTAFIQNLAATGRRPTQRELQAYGIDAETAMAMANAQINVGPTRRRSNNTRPTPRTKRNQTDLGSILPEE